MGGHSHWAGIKHKKAITDAKKGKVFTRLIREITIAARMGGGDPGSNARLRKAIDDARAANMPSDNVKRAIKKGTGEIPGAMFEELLFEGYGPGGIAIIADATSDNKNRTTSEIRRIFSNHGGNLGESGSVGWIFENRGYITVKKSAVAEDKLMDLVLELGADDLKSDEAEVYEIFTTPQTFDAVKNGLAARKIPVESAEVTKIPKNEVPVDEATAGKVLSLINELEEHDDIKTVYANFDIPDQVLAKLESK
jgi:YebC/PmpR family DNA-binding regulatory protein